MRLRLSVPSRLRLPHAIILLIMGLITFSVPPLYSDSKSIARREIPAELQPSDPEVKNLIDEATDRVELGDLEKALKLTKDAWDLCNSKHLVTDLPIVGLELSSLLISKGDFDGARQLLTKSLEIAAERPNPALKASILIALASIREISGDRKGALEINKRALDEAQAGKNLYVQARALGESGRMWLAAGGRKEARAALTAALDIDKANNYSLEALHQVYWAYVLLVESNQNLSAAVEVLEKALKLANATGYGYAAFTATNYLGAAYIAQGDVKRGLDLLNASPHNKSLILDFSRLEILAIAYQIGRQPDKSAETWGLLLEQARTVGNNYFVGEAAHKLADLSRDKGQIDQAFSYYEMAAHSLRLVGNETELLNVLTSEIPLLTTAKRDDIAPRIYAETLELVKKEKGKPSNDLQFALYLGWSFYYKQHQSWRNEVDNLERAESLVPETPPGTMRDSSLTRTLMAMWVDHALAAAQLRLPYVSILAQEQAFQCASQLKDDKAQGIVMAAILEGEQTLEGYRNLRAVCDSNQLQSCFEAALALNTLELLNEEWRSKWKAEQGLTIAKLTVLPEQLTASSEGVQFLNRESSLISPIEWTTRLLIDLALAKHYLFSANEPASARTRLENADSLLTKTNIEGNPPAEVGLKQGLLTTHCWLALSLAQTGEPSRAETKLETCLQEAKELGTQQAMNFAEATSASVRMLNNNPTETEATEYWVKVLGDSPDMHRAHSFALARTKNYEGAIREMNLAASIYEKKGSDPDVAQCFMSLALYYEMKKQPEYPVAVSILQRALLIAEKLHDEKLQAKFHFSLGIAYQAEEQNSDARHAFGEAQRIAEKTGDLEISARSLWGMAEIVANTQPNEADILYARASDLFSKAGMLDPQSRVLVERANVVRHTRGNEEALQLLLNACDIAEQSKSSGAGAVAYSALGQAYQSEGQYSNALLAYDTARAKAVIDKNLLAQAYGDLAISGVFQLIGEWRSALENATSALNVFKAIGDERGELLAYSEVIAVYTERNSDLKNFQKATSTYAEASAVPAFKTNSLFLNLSLLEMYQQTREYKKLIEMATGLIPECTRSKDNVCLGHLHISLADAYSEVGEYTKAREELAASNVFVEHEANYYLSGRFMYARARLEKNSGDLDAAIKDYTDVLRMISALQIVDLQASSAISETYSFIFDELIAALYQKSRVHPSSTIDYAELAIQTAEGDKSQLFNRLWGTRFADASRRKLPTDIREKESELQHRKSELSQELHDALAAGARPRKPAVEVRSELARTDNELDDFVSKLRTKYPSYSMIRYPRPVEVKGIPLHDDELLVECRVAEDSSYVWFVRKAEGGHPRVFLFYSIPNGRKWIRAQVNKIKAGISEAQIGGFDPKSVQDLATALFPSFAYASLRAAKSIIYVPDDALALIPLEMLSPDAAKGFYPLVEIPTTYYPSTEAMIISRAVKAENQWQSKLLAIGDPITSQTDPRWEAVAEISAPQNLEPPETPSSVASKLRSAGIAFERLPGTAAEIQGISQLIEGTGGNAEIRLGIDANRQKLLDTDLRNYRFIHFATHGLLPTDSGLQEPALLFSYDGKEGDMFLQLSQVLDLPLQADMVVLSACNTGSGEVKKSEGVYNLGRAFLTAGASSVVVSMWEVADNSTATFMKELYRSILNGEPKNVALMHARLALINQGFDQPFYWAPFILMGE